MLERQPIVRIVIADDDADVRRDLRDLLEITGGMKVVGEAADGHAALEAARMLSPDVVILDLDMPVLDGFAAAQRIKAETPNISLVALTIFADDSSRRRADAAGINAFIVKGAPLSELLGAVRPLGSRPCTEQGGQS
jgi:two-component system, NarL family, response regulator DesR